MRHFFVKASVVVILLLVVGYVLFEISGSRTFQLRKMNPILEV